MLAGHNTKITKRYCGKNEPTPQADGLAASCNAPPFILPWKNGKVPKITNAKTNGARLYHPSQSRPCDKSQPVFRGVKCDRHVLRMARYNHQNCSRTRRLCNPDIFLLAFDFDSADDPKTKFEPNRLNDRLCIDLTRTHRSRLRNSFHDPFFEPQI